MHKEYTGENTQLVHSLLYGHGVIDYEFSSPVRDELTRLQPGLAALVKTGKRTTGFLLKPLDSLYNRIVKRIFDILFSLVIIILLLSWLAPLLALLIIIDSKGPVFFLQKRNKKNGEIFTCIKFRSMIVNSGANILPAVAKDKRITVIGRFLRARFLDELPQFLNVLKGDMSVIGPRPHMISDNIKYERQHKQYVHRHAIKPGITGLAQVMGFAGIANDPLSIQRRLNMDIFYIRHWSFKMDLMILYRTFLGLFT